MNTWHKLNTIQKDIIRFIAATKKASAEKGPSQGDIADYIAKVDQHAMRNAAMKQELDLLRRMGLIDWEKGKFAGTVRVLIAIPES